MASAFDDVAGYYRNPSTELLPFVPSKDNEARQEFLHSEGRSLATAVIRIHPPIPAQTACRRVNIAESRSLSDRKGLHVRNLVEHSPFGTRHKAYWGLDMLVGPPETAFAHAFVSRSIVPETDPV